MKRIRYIYMFWFYKLYMFLEKNSTYGINDWKAVLIIGVFEMLTMLSLFIYFGLAIGHIYFPDNPIPLITIVVIILGVKHYRFYYKNSRWKKYLHLCKLLNQKKKNRYCMIYKTASSILIFNILLMYILLYSLY